MLTAAVCADVFDFTSVPAEPPQVLCFSEAEGPQQQALPALAQMQMQQRAPTTFLPPFLLKRMALQHQKGEEDINASFSKLLSELNKPDAMYSLSLANRLYGEKTYQFVQLAARESL
ncbi:unnamed protein product [Boreogadus saida]